MEEENKDTLGSSEIYVKEVVECVEKGDIETTRIKIHELAEKCHKKKINAHTPPCQKLLTILLVESKFEKYDPIAELEVARALVSNAADRKQVQDEKGVETLTAIILNNPTNRGLLSATFATLRAFVTASKENKATFQKSGSFSALLNYIQTEQEIQYLLNAMGCLGSLLASPLLKDTFGEMNGVQIILHILENHKENEDVVHKCCVVLRNGAAGKNKEIVFQNKGLELVMECLRAIPLNREVQHEGLMFLHNMITASDQVRERILDLGLVDLLNIGFKNHPNTEGCIRCARQITIGILASDDKPENEKMQLINSINLVKNMIACLKDDEADTELKDFCFDTLKLVAEYPESHPFFVEEHAVEILLDYTDTTDVWPTIYYLLENESAVEEFLEHDGLSAAVESVKVPECPPAELFHIFSVIAALVLDDNVRERIRPKLNELNFLPLIPKITQSLTEEQIKELHQELIKTPFQAIPRLLFAHSARIQNMVKNYAPKCVALCNLAIQMGEQYERALCLPQHVGIQHRFEMPHSYAHRMQFMQSCPTAMIMWNGKLVSFDANFIYFTDPETLTVLQKVNVEKVPQNGFVDLGMSCAVGWKDALFTVSYTGHLYKWMTSTHEFKCAVAEEGYISDIIVWGDLLVTVGNSYEIQMWEFDLNRVNSQKVTFRTWCAAVVPHEYTNDKKEPKYTKSGYLALGGSDRKVHIMDMEENQLKQIEIWKNEVSDYPVHSIAVIPGNAVAFGDSVGHCGMKVATGVIDVDAHQNEVKRLVVWPSKEILITCGNCNDIVFWNYKGGNSLCRIESYDRHMNSVVIHNDSIFYQDIFGNICHVVLRSDCTNVVSNKKKGLRAQQDVPVVTYSLIGQVPQEIPESVYYEAQDDSDSDISNKEEVAEEDETGEDD